MHKIPDFVFYYDILGYGLTEPDGGAILQKGKP